MSNHHPTVIFPIPSPVGRGWSAAEGEGLGVMVDSGLETNENPTIDRTDGVSVEFADWRFNLRGSNTEPLLRLNVEARGNSGIVKKHLTIIEKLIQVLS